MSAMELKLREYELYAEHGLEHKYKSVFQQPEKTMYRRFASQIKVNVIYPIQIPNFQPQFHQFRQITKENAPRYHHM